MANLLAFSNEVRRTSINKELHGSLAIDKMPRMRQCCGRLQFMGEKLRSCIGTKFEPPYIKVDKIVRSINDTKLYTAVIYEFIEETKNDHGDVQLVLEFLWRAGFSLTLSPLAANWKQGVLVDGSDVVSPGSYGWDKVAYGMRFPKAVLRE
jgi:hypothetical protein